MKMKKILAMLTLATVLSSGVGAHAVDFSPTTNGSQEAKDFADTANDPNAMPKAAEGKIEVNGKFKKTITNFPKPDKNGRYLNVSMPIKLDFEYDTDSNSLISAKGTVINGSVKAENIQANGQGGTITPQPITMEILELTDDALNNNNNLVDFVTTVDPNVKDKVQVPLNLKLSRAGQSIKDYSLETLSGNGFSEKISMNANDQVQLEFGIIPGQKVSNLELFNDDITTTKHNLNFKFEYAGN